MVTIRAASPADGAAVAVVQRASWFAAYSGIVEESIIDRVTTPDGGARIRQSFRTRPQRMLVAVGPASAGTANADVVGYASFGPELDVTGTTWPHPVTAAGAAGKIGELYALYVHPDWWSTGTGRALMERVLYLLHRAGYRTVTLWVLDKNTRARAFYQRAGFTPDGATHLLPGLGGVVEVRYRREPARTDAWPRRSAARRQ